MTKELIGAHTSIQGGVGNALFRAKDIGANTLQLFTANQRQWGAKKVTEEDLLLFKTAKDETKISTVISHGSYLVNLGSPKKEGLEMSRKAFLEEIERCQAYGIDYLVFHPGSALDSSENECLDTIVDSLLTFETFLEKGKTKLLLETTAGQGSNLGYKFEHLGYIIDNTKRNIELGVCLDTCHIYSAGYDISTKSKWDSTMNQFDKIVGLKNLLAFHVNDSKTPFNSRKDRHESLGQGSLGIEAFEALMQDNRFITVPKILETPVEEKWIDEIKLLKEFAR